MFASPVAQDFQRIVLPIDFSVSADRALPRALALAERFHAEIHLLHVLVPTPEGHTEEEATGVYRAGQARLRLDAIRLAYRWAIAGKAHVAFHTAVLNAEHAADGIVAYARSHGADLLAMTTHGWGCCADEVTGSVTRAVLDAAACAVLTVPVAQPTTGAIRRVLVPTGHGAAYQSALYHAGRLALRFDATLLHLALADAEAFTPADPPVCVGDGLPALAHPTVHASVLTPDAVRPSDVLVLLPGPSPSALPATACSLLQIPRG